MIRKALLLLLAALLATYSLPAATVASPNVGDYITPSGYAFSIPGQEGFMGIDSDYDANWTRPVLSINSSSYVERGPIAITGDADFLLMAANEGWSGNGTQVSPFIITNCLFMVPSESSGINITDVSLSFIIDDCVFMNEDENETLPPMDSAIHITNSCLVSIRGVTIVHANAGILLELVDGATILNSSILYCGYASIWASDAPCLTVLNVTIDRAPVGMIMLNSPMVEIINCRLNDFEFSGIYLDKTPNSSVIGNNCTRASLLLTYDADVRSSLTLTDNLVNGLPLAFIRDVDMAGGMINTNVGQLILHNVSNAVVSNYSGTPYATYGVFIGSSSNILVEDSELSCREICLPIADSTNVTVRNCTFGEVVFTIGVYLANSANCTVTENTFSDMWFGTKFDSSDGNTVSFNTFESAIGFDIDEFSSYNTYICNLNDGGAISGAVFGDHNAFVSNNITPWSTTSGNETTLILAYDNGDDNIWSLSGAPHGYGNYWGILNCSQADGIYAAEVALNGSAGSFDYFPLAAAASLPSAPINVTASVAGLKVVLSWMPPATTGGSSIIYTVYRSDGSAYSALAQTGALTYNDTSVQDGKAYTYQVSATNLFGEGSKTGTAVAVPASFDYFLLALVVIFVGLLVLWFIVSRHRR
jgi:parallel beta-helix repeat protein